MKNETKLKKLMGWLDENNIEYRCPSGEMSEYKRRKRSDLFIPRFTVSVRIDDDYTQKWYRTHYDRNPVIIRDTDTPKFLIEKIQNTITRVMINQQKHYMREQDRKKTKLKR